MPFPDLALPDVLTLGLEEMAALMPLGLDEAVQRVLPEAPPETVDLNSAFASSI